VGDEKKKSAPTISLGSLKISPLANWDGVSTVPLPSYTSTVRYRPRRVGSARLALEEEGCCLAEGGSTQISVTIPTLFLIG